MANATSSKTSDARQDHHDKRDCRLWLAEEESLLIALRYQSQTRSWVSVIQTFNSRVPEHRRRSYDSITTKWRSLKLRSQQINSSGYHKNLDMASDLMASAHHSTSYAPWGDTSQSELGFLLSTYSSTEDVNGSLAMLNQHAAAAAEATYAASGGYSGWL